MEKTKIQQALEKYDLNLDDKQVAAEVKALLDAHLEENMTPEVKKFLMGSIELTTLKCTDCDRSVSVSTVSTRSTLPYPMSPRYVCSRVSPRLSRTR